VPELRHIRISSHDQEIGATFVGGAAGYGAASQVEIIQWASFVP
jgi:hypothetical protein